MLEISDKLLDSLSIEEIVELKIEIDDLLNKLDNIVDTCDIALSE